MDRPTKPSGPLRRIFTIVLVVSASAVALAAVTLVMWPSALQVTYGPWNKTFATLGQGNVIEAVVHGSTDSPLSGWDADLLWKKDNDRWYVYYLNHEAYFERYALRRTETGIDVLCNGTLVGKLDTTNGVFFHIRQNLLYKRPLDVIHGANMHEREKWIRWNPPN